MTKDDREIGTALRQVLTQRLGRERCEVWFSGEMQCCRRGTRLTLMAPDDFLAERWRQSFHAELLGACRQVDPAITALTIQTGAHLAEQGSSSASQAGQDVLPAARSGTGVASTATAEEREPSSAAGRLARPAASSRSSASAARRSRRRARFDDLVVGDSNRVAATAAAAVVERPGEVSPLFLYGATGSGKTHLVEAIWTAEKRKPGPFRGLYLSSEQFTSSFVEALQGKGLPSFRHKYRNVEVLLMDDLQFFAGKRATVVELQNTVDALLRQRRQLVFTADRPPGELTFLGTELVARLSGGLVCCLQPPDLETRRRILEHYANRVALELPDEALAWMAETLPPDARMLRGAVNRVAATHRATSQPLTRRLTEEVLSDMLLTARRSVALPDIERAVCEVFGLQPRSLQSSARSRDVTWPRMMAMWLARKHTRAVFSEIGRYFGRRSHSTVISAEAKVEAWLENGQRVDISQGPCDVREAIRRVEQTLRCG